MKVNGCPIELLEPEILRVKVFEPLLLLGQERFAGVDMRIRVRGGGYTSQIYAIRQAIAKGIVAYYQKCTCAHCLWKLMMSDHSRKSVRCCTGFLRRVAWLRRTCGGSSLPVAIACAVRAESGYAPLWAMVCARAAPGRVFVIDVLVHTVETCRHASFSSAQCLSLGLGLGGGARENSYWRRWGAASSLGWCRSDG